MIFEDVQKRAIKFNPLNKEDKALVKETGEIHEVKSKYSIRHVSMTIDFDYSDSDIKTKTEFVHDSETQEEGDYYTLDDGKTYHDKDVIIGVDEIRDHKLKDII